MYIIDCKECGGRNEVAVGASYITCAYCGKQITVPSAKDEERVRLFNRANEFRRQGEFDKAIRAFSGIAEQDASDPEATWGLVLSKYGIEYVEDPRTGERIPTCNRVSAESILTDSDYLATLDNSPNEYVKSLYIKEAKRIDRIQKGILAIAKQEEPFDIFICYKETTNGGSRTEDSVLAQDIYEKLKKEGLRVFFSRITLEDKLGHQYEPYIFAALNSAKVMLVVTTNSNNVNSPWVKNEWSRYLSIMRLDHEKVLIPCYLKINVYDLPEELNIYQCQDMSKIGAMQDLVRGVKKICANSQKTTPYQNHSQGNTSALLDRGYICLKDADFNKADQLFEQVLNYNPHDAKAYLGKLMTERHVCIEDNLREESVLLERSKNYNHILEYGDINLKSRVMSYAFDVSKTVKKNLIDLIEDAYRKIRNSIKRENDQLNEQLSVSQERKEEAERILKNAEKGMEVTMKFNKKSTSGYIYSMIIIILWLLFCFIVMGSDIDVLPDFLKSDRLHMIMGLSFFPCLGLLIYLVFSFISGSGERKRANDRRMSRQIEFRDNTQNGLTAYENEIASIQRNLIINRDRKNTLKSKMGELIKMVENAREEELMDIEDRVKKTIKMLGGDNIT